MPVQGDINDPEFKIGGVIWQAFTTLITKVVTAPFRLLGNLIGVDSEDFGQFQFLTGRSDMTPPELEKVAQLEQALAQMEPIDQEVLALRHFEELSNQEVAEVLGIQQKASSIRYIRAIGRLKNILARIPGFEELKDSC